MTYMRLINGQLAYHVKRKAEFFQFFHTRYNLYKQIYNYHVTKAIEYMIRDALLEANSFLQIERALDDPELYLTLTDGILDRIRSAPGLDRAKQILNRIDRRQFYKMKKSMSTEPTLSDLEGLVNPIVQKVQINYGLGEENPLTKIPFHNDSNEVFYLSEFEMILPSTFQETSYRIFSD